ncbi:MAG: GAF domain-containing protein [Acidimicrobiia bacterium]
MKARARPEAEASRQLRTVRNLATIRWAAIVWALVQVTTYYLPYPAGVFPWALAAVGVLVVGNTGIWLALPRACTAAAVRRLALASVLVDGIAIVLLVFVYTFDPDTAIWAVLYIVPLGAAVLFELRGALWTMGVVTLLYVVREVYGHLAFGNELLPVSISFRMGVGFIIAAFAGAMASGLLSRLRELAGLNRITQTVADERELTRALEAVTGEMLSVLDVRTAAIGLLEPQAGAVSVLSECSVDGAEGGRMSGHRFPVEGSPALQELARDATPVFLAGPDDPAAGPELAEVMRAGRGGGLLVVPLQVRSETIGAILLESSEPGRRFKADEVSLAETVAGQIAGAIENARLFDELVEYVEQVSRVTAAASAVESGTFRAEILDQVGERSDALGQLARVFQGMAREVAAREQRLRREVQQLRIEIDESRAARQVEEITESEYFRRLQMKVDELRIETGGNRS